MITVSISGRKATLLNTEDLPTGNDSSIKVNFIFDDSELIWKNSRKLAIFYAVTPKGLKKRLPAVITDENECYIPGKIISTPYSRIEIGVTAEHEDGSSVSTNNVFLNKTKPGAGGDSEFDYDEQPVNKNDFDEFLTDLAVSVDSKIFELQSDLKNGGYVKSSDLPTKTSELENDSGFITESDFPTKTSQLVNDSGFTTASDLPTKTSQLENDSGFITLGDLPDPELPSVTEADNGKVLRVVDGVWAVDTMPDNSEQVVAELESMIDESGVLA